MVLWLLVAGSLSDAVYAQTPPSASSYDVTPQRLALIPAGTVIDQQAPKGWTHLLNKAHSKVGAGDINAMNPQTTQIATFLFSALVANVQAHQVPGQTRYRLAALAVGVGTRIRNQDVIISSDSAERLGAGLSLLQRIALRRTEARLAEVQSLVRSETMMIFDSPTQVQRDGRHRSGILRYTVLVDEKTGHLTPFFWFVAIDEQGRYASSADTFELLPPNKIEECVLHIDGREFSLGLITEKAIALNRLPAGVKQFPIPEGLKPTVTRARFTRETANDVESYLRTLKTTDR